MLTCNNFVFHSPTKIIFGAKTISQLKNEIPQKAKILMIYGSGSIKKNGVYDQVKEALKEHNVMEFSGITPNPRYETAIKAVEICKKENIDFLLAVGGGSVIDATKFISIASKYPGKDPWDIMPHKNNQLKNLFQPTEAIPIGTVLTIPATGSEMNTGYVITRESTKEKVGRIDQLVIPKFSILDPETSYSLPKRQIINGIVDSFVHVTEQYLTTFRNTKISDRFAEGVIDTLISEAPVVLKNPKDYSARANIMWASTMALNRLIGCGVDFDGATHSIGHEITAMNDSDHAKTLAAVIKGVLIYKKQQKMKKLVLMAERIYGKKEGTDEEKADFAISETIKFFNSIGMKTTLSSVGIKKENFQEIADRIEERTKTMGFGLGEHRDIYKDDVLKILELCDP
ncbi:alcohol dehydrogenase [Anaeramoeba ignava]|uniref:Alcohol dehydrogenase n=1 Tax=Anaeramoeba ignava TaxID=1746090 RepID=A0A9Q0REX7_ANAIG|nr:alcohol dehydrogenase [Anaeramoeba ignava]